MKTKIKFMLVALMATVIFSSCERVAPNYAGVLMENYGKKGKNDFKIVSGKVSTWDTNPAAMPRRYTTLRNT